MTTTERPDLDMTAEYRVVHVEPGTPYADEPTETIPPGWYVIGARMDDEDGEDVVLKVENAYDLNGNDVTEKFARRLADLLEGYFLGLDDGGFSLPDGYFGAENGQPTP